MFAPLAALLLAAAAPDTAWGAIRGTVQSEPGGTPLPSAVVEATGGGQTLTDSTGAYLLPRVAAGRQTLRVHSIDHEPFEVEVYVPARGEVVLGVGLRHRPLALDTLQAAGGGAGGAPSDPVPRGEAAITDLTAFEGPGTGLDPAAPAGGGGGGGGGSGEDVLLVRGSAADLKLVLLDGAPVYAPFHMAGLIDSFEPGLLSGARLYLGGAPARYDGGVSYVLDLATRGASTERWSGAASADMVAVRGEADGPLWRGAGLLLASRAIHGASLGRLEGQPFPYAYADGLARLDVSLGRGMRLAATGFGNGESVRVDTTPWRDNFLRWSNRAGSARVRGQAFGAQGELTLALSEFDAWLPNAGKQLVVQSHQERARVALDFTRDLGALRLGYGYAWDRQWARHRVLDRSGGERLVFARDTFGTVGGWYLDALWRGGRRWLARGGLRGDMYAGGPFIAFSPRLALTWMPTSHAALTLAGGRYHQLVLSRNREPFDYGDPDLANQLGIPTVLAVAGGTHLTLALDQELARGVRLGLEGYYKRFEDIPDPEEVGNVASGVDVWVRRGEGAVSGWMGYSLAWYWARPGALPLPDTTAARPPRLSGRQTLSVGVAAAGRHGRAELRVAYGSGLPYSAVGETGPGSGTPADTPPPTVPGEVAGPLASVPQDFLRLDLQLSRTFSPRLHGHETALTPYVRVMNALDRRDNLFYRYSRTGDPAANPAATLPLLPVLGLEWKL
jgi:hypothetical protein